MRFELYGTSSLNFVEFNITGNTDLFQRCDKDSLFMDSEIFTIFSESFERSNNLFDYFGPTKYSTRNLVVLLNELKKNYAQIVAIKSYDHFVDFAGNKFMGSSFVLEIEKKDKNWRLNWEQYVTKLSDVNQQLSNLINRCIDEERLLWVVGY